MSVLQFVLLYLGAGLFFLVLALVVNRIFKLNLFMEYHSGSWSRNGVEFAILFGWVVIVPMEAIVSLFFLLSRFSGLFIGKPPLDGTWKDGLYDSLLEKGLSPGEARKVLDEVGEAEGD
jgi:hypothetical protein